MKEKKRMKKKHDSNRLIYFFVTLGILMAVAVGVYALTAGIKPNPGHTINELSPPIGCSAGQFLQFDGTNWTCSSSAGGSACPSGMTPSYSYVNEGEDSYHEFPVGNPEPTTNIYGPDTCNGDTVNMLTPAQSSSLGFIAHPGLECNADTSISCRDVWKTSYCYQCTQFYMAADYTCKRRATLKCVE
jgi:hypothetical protein